MIYQGYKVPVCQGSLCKRFLVGGRGLEQVVGCLDSIPVKTFLGF